MIVEHYPSLILITDITEGVLVKQKYIGYTETEAKEIFRRKYYDNEHRNS